jgi:hypothetical protein
MMTSAATAPRYHHQFYRDRQILVGAGLRLLQSRLPFRKKICGECGGTGKVTALRREQLLRRAKARG